MELARRRVDVEPKKKKIIKTSQDIFEIFGNLLGDLQHEEFWVLLLNGGNKVIGKQKIGQGGISVTVADIRLIMKYAVENSAVSIVVCHNHPSGNVNPGKDDENLTKQISEAGKILNIPMLDHIIVCESGYFSFSDEGKL
jgi:DNA repair protein RadC